jgi:predicted RNA-binding Zn-ribbon protein involved in translation (DUF1610 family)
MKIEIVKCVCGNEIAVDGKRQFVICNKCGKKIQKRDNKIEFYQIS